MIGIKCRNSLPLRTQDNYKHKNMGGKTAMYPWKSYVILLYEILIYLRNIIFQVRITLSICWTTKPFHNLNSKCINEIPLFIVISYQQIKEMIDILLCINHNCYLYMPSWGPDLVNKLISIQGYK